MKLVHIVLSIKKLKKKKIMKNNHDLSPLIAKHKYCWYTYAIYCSLIQFVKMHFLNL